MSLFKTKKVKDVKNTKNVKQDKIKKANSLVEELENLQEFSSFFTRSKYGPAAHFEILQHYTCTDYDYNRRVIPSRYNERLMAVIKEIINEMEKEIEEL